MGGPSQHMWRRLTRFLVSLRHAALRGCLPLADAGAHRLFPPPEPTAHASRSPPLPPRPCRARGRPRILGPFPLLGPGTNRRPSCRLPAPRPPLAPASHLTFCLGIFASDRTQSRAGAGTLLVRRPRPTTPCAVAAVLVMRAAAGAAIVWRPCASH